MMDNSLSPFTKAYLWKTICSPTVLHGMDSIPINKSELAKLEAFQGSRHVACGIGPGGVTWVFRGAHTFVIKVKNDPISTDFWPKKHPYFNKTLIFPTK